VKTLGNFTLLAGEALYKDDSLNLTPEQAVFITQIIAEWSFHKSIDLVHSGILPEYWDGIMQKIAFTIFEVAKQAIIRKIPQEQLLQAVEHHVVKVYKSSIEELEQKGIIDENTKNRAESQSNIDAMAQQAQAEQQKQAQEAAEQAQNAQNDAEKR
jgi:primosomal protein N'